MRHLSWLLLVVLSITSRGGVAPRLVGGFPAGGRFPYVFIFAEEHGEFIESYCTGAKVGPGLFLTAAHCVLAQWGSEEDGHWYLPAAFTPGRTLRYSFATDFSQAQALFRLRIKRVHLPPPLERCLKTGVEAGGGLCRRTDVPQPDMALVEVYETEDFKAAPKVSMDFRQVKVGDEITILGYGVQGDDDQDPPLLKFGEVVVPKEEDLTKAIHGFNLGKEINFSLFFGALGVLIDPDIANLGSGDSGGPVLRGNPLRVVGINSFGLCPINKPRCEASTNSFFSRLDAQAEFQAEPWMTKWLKSDLF